MSALAVLAALLSQSEGTAPPKAGEELRTDTLEERVTEKGEFRISDMKKPLLKAPFVALEATISSLTSLGAPAELVSATQRLAAAAKRKDTSAVMSVAGSLEDPKGYEGVSAFLSAAADFDVGRFNYAARDLDRLLEETPKTPLRRQARALSVLAYLYSGQADRAQQVGARLITDEERDVAFESFNGWLYWGTAEADYYRKDYEVAERHFTKNIALNPDPLVVAYSRLGAAWCNLHQGRAGDALVQFRTLTSSTDPHLAASATLGEAIAAFNSYDYVGADSIIATVRPPAGDVALVTETLYQAGFIARVNGDDERAIADWRRLVSDYARYTRAADAAFRLGELYTYLDKVDESIAIYEWLIKTSPDYPAVEMVLYRVGELYYSKKNYEAALDAFKQFLARFPKHSLAEKVSERTQQTYFMLARNDEAYVKPFLDDYPNSEDAAEALYIWGSKHYDADDMDTSATLFYRLALLFPHHDRAPDALFYAAQIFYNQKKWSDAAAAFEKYIKNYKGHEEIQTGRILLAVSYLKLEKFGTAIKMLTNILNKESLDDPERADIHRWLGMAYYEMGASEKAVKHLEEAKMLYFDLGKLDDMDAVDKVLRSLPH